MGDGRRCTVAEVEGLAAAVLDRDDLRAQHHPVGFSNENWKLLDATGCRYLLKVGDRTMASKWTSSLAAYEQAAAVGVPVPAVVHVGSHDDHLVRIFAWIDGEPASTVVPGTAQSRRLLTSVGSAVRTLHTAAQPGFSSRLDGSAPRFATWRDYVGQRVTQIRARGEATGAVDPLLLDRACALAADLVAEVSDVAEPVLCHRDLHPDNLIVDRDGDLVGIIDWDGAEAWDRAGDWYKLEHELLRLHPDGREVLLDAYLDGGPTPAAWAPRRRLVDLLESLNVLPNAVTEGWSAGFADRARTLLLETLDPDGTPLGP